jgi:hypothetical protein
MAWAGRRLWLVVRTVIRAAGPLRWVPSLGGYRLAGSHLPAQDPSQTGR